MPEELARGKAWVTVKWCDVNKGGHERPEYRSRLVARELKAWGPTMGGAFAATPPTESLRFMLSSLATEKMVAGRVQENVMAVWDVSRAHFHPPALREVYIKLPGEDAEPGKVGIFRRPCMARETRRRSGANTTPTR